MNEENIEIQREELDFIIYKFQEIISKNKNMINQLKYDNISHAHTVNKLFKIKYPNIEKDVIEFIETKTKKSKTLTVKEIQKFIINNNIIEELIEITRINEKVTGEKIPITIEKHNLCIDKIWVNINTFAKPETTIIVLEKIQELLAGSSTQDIICVNINFLK